MKKTPKCVRLSSQMENDIQKTARRLGLSESEVMRITIELGLSQLRAGGKKVT